MAGAVVDAVPADAGSALCDAGVGGVDGVVMGGATVQQRS